MNESDIDLPSRLRAVLISSTPPGTPLSARQLQKATRKSQPSVSLALARLGFEVCKLGAARSTRYALAQPIFGLEGRQNLTWTTPKGQMQPFGTLFFLRGNRLAVQTRQGDEWLGAPGEMPWFLQGLRPQGFLGRQLTRLRPDYPSDPDDWTLAQVLYMAINHATDPPGAIHAGDTLGRIVQEAPWPLADRAAYFDTLARAITQGVPVGSSAGGEQPKFVTQWQSPTGQHSHAIVKYAPPRGTPFGERWHELLHLEHWANRVLADHGIATATTQVIESPLRTYLASERFDRMGHEGKRHVVAASAVHEGFVKSSRRHWVATAEALHQQKMLSDEHVKSIACTYFFGQYIGNTDMHFGNLSFFADGAINSIARPLLQPTPMYDMLPMMWRPSVHDGSLEAAPVRPQTQPAGFADQAAQARLWAIDYWERAAQLPALSQALRDASAASAQCLKTNFAA